jgi:hypothetical protein
MRFRHLLPVLTLFLAACSQTDHSPAAQAVISIESRFLVFPTPAYVRLAAEAPQFFSPPATPSARPVVDNYELSLLLQKIGSDARTTTITAPRAAIPNHHTGTIPYPTTDTHGQPAELLVLLRPMLIVP